MEQKEFKTTLQNNSGKDIEVNISGNVLKIGLGQINLRALHRMFSERELECFTVALENVRLSHSLLMAQYINLEGEKDDEVYVASPNDLYTLERLISHLKELESE